MSKSHQLQLLDWCRGEGISVKHSLLLYGVPEYEDIAVIEATVPTVKALGRVRVRGKMFDTQTQTLTVLCGCKEEVDPSRVPPELLSPREGERWTVVVAQPQQDNFSEKLAQFLQGEGKTMEDIATANTGGSEWNPESIIRAVGEVLRQSLKSTESNNV